MARNFRQKRKPAKTFLQKAKRQPPIVVAIATFVGSAYGLHSMLHTSTTLALEIGTIASSAVWLLSLFFGYGAVYVIGSYHPVTGQKVCAYVGKTHRYPVETRIREHLYGSRRYGKEHQPWEDTVCRWWVAYESWYVTKPGTALREYLNIRMRRPIYNYIWNLKNIRRIPVYVAIEQRKQRDYRRGLVKR